MTRPGDLERLAPLDSIGLSLSYCWVPSAVFTVVGLLELSITPLPPPFKTLTITPKSHPRLSTTVLRSFISYSRCSSFVYALYGPLNPYRHEA
ncbi:hypothetical protein OPQ81_008776 [Rhizoctonia solani]|nr:hypothetical protein OPQ81_008776 [Rhizoctonia solani]